MNIAFGRFLRDSVLHRFRPDGFGCVSSPLRSDLDAPSERILERHFHARGCFLGRHFHARDCFGAPFSRSGLLWGAIFTRSRIWTASFKISRRDLGGVFIVAEVGTSPFQSGRLLACLLQPEAICSPLTVVWLLSILLIIRILYPVHLNRFLLGPPFCSAFVLPSHFGLLLCSIGCGLRAENGGGERRTSFRWARLRF